MTSLAFTCDKYYLMIINTAFPGLCLTNDLICLFVTEIPNFLSDLECEHIMALSESFGLSSSGLHIDDYAKKNKQFTHGKYSNICGVSYPVDIQQSSFEFYALIDQL